MNALAEAQVLTDDQLERITIPEAVMLGAEDQDFFGRFFFPKAYRQSSPNFALPLDAALDDPQARYVSAMVFRGASKTTRLRVFCARRVSYAISRTIIFVGKSQEHAIRSVKWLKKQVEFNKKWTQIFNIQKGATWTDSEIEIFNATEEVSITIIALGITGSTRGVNIDDYRPDLIIVDDPCDEENTGTPEQRKKIADLFFGALEKSLAPRSEAPHATMVLLQTVLNDEDLISLTFKDSQWTTFRISCFDEHGRSVWPERFPTEDLKEDKQSSIDRGQLALWLREMECKVVSEENSAFARHLVKFWDVLPDQGIRIIAVDPTPPARDPVDSGPNKRLQKLDDAVIGVLQVSDAGIFVVDTWDAKAPDDEELLEAIFTMALEWRPIQKIAVETVLFARMLSKALRRKMQQKKQYFAVDEIEDRRPKQTRIRQEISAYAANGKLYFHRSQQQMWSQYVAYPNVNHDDFLDMLSLGIMSIEPWMWGASLIEGEFEDITDVPELKDWRGAP